MQAQNVPAIRTTSTPSLPGEVVLRTHDLTKQYGERFAVNRLNLEVRSGEIVGFLGPNGAGKTTSIRMILGLIAPTSGRVELFGRDLASERAQLLPRVGALVETPALYLHLTGRENLRAVGAVLGGVSPQRIGTVLELIGLHARQRDRARKYSLGMKQRLASEGKTVFLSSHLLSEVQQICSRVVFLNAGKLIADKTIEELTRGQGEYAVRLEHPQEALALLRQQPWGQTARLTDDGTLLTPAPQQRGRELSAFLAQAGFPPESLAPAVQNLEEVFFSLINAHEGEK